MALNSAGAPELSRLPCRLIVYRLMRPSLFTGHASSISRDQSASPKVAILNGPFDARVTNACRCGTYYRIRKAIHLAADLMGK
jgi:hypothetical protein